MGVENVEITVTGNDTEGRREGKEGTKGITKRNRDREREGGLRYEKPFTVEFQLVISTSNVSNNIILVLVVMRFTEI
jgi:hypothetical protein